MSRSRKLDSTRILVNGKVVFDSLSVEFGKQVFNSCVGIGSSMAAPFHKRPIDSVVELQQACVNKLGEIEYQWMSIGHV